MDGSALADEISLRLLDAPTKIILRTGDDEKVATLQDLRDYLAPLGLDITTESALCWGLRNPVQAAHIDQICDLTQRAADLELRLLQKEAAE